MITITFKKIVTEGYAEHSYSASRTVKWHLHSKLNQSLLNDTVSEEAGWKPVLVEADGEELTWLGVNISGIPRAIQATHPIQRWRGDIAAFIFDHLPRGE